jgi:hypothetical protein
MAGEQRNRIVWNVLKLKLPTLHSQAESLLSAEKQTEE